MFRCESAILRVHWVLVVMDQCTRRIVGFGVHRGAVDGVGLCRMFNQCRANLRILDIEEIKTVPYGCTR